MCFVNSDLQTFSFHHEFLHQEPIPGFYGPAWFAMSWQFERCLWDDDMKQEQEASTCLLSWLWHYFWRSDHVLVMDAEEK